MWFGVYFLSHQRTMEENNQEKKALTEAGAPQKNNFIFTAFLLAGVGYNLPNYCLTAAVDYYQYRFPNTTIIFDMVAVRHSFVVLGFLLNNMLVESLDLKWRILYSYVTFGTLLTSLTICDVTLELFSYDVSYAMPLVVTAITSVALAVQQSSFYGYANMLPGRYTQAVTIGENVVPNMSLMVCVTGVSGVVVSMARISTKLMLKDERVNTILFFAFADLTIVVCCVIFILTRRTNFVTFYINYCHSETEKGTDSVQPTNLIDGANVVDSKATPHTGSSESKYGSTIGALSGNDGVMTEQTISRGVNPETQTNSMTDNSLYAVAEGDNSNQTEEDLKPIMDEHNNYREEPMPHRSSKIKAMLQYRWEITKQIYPFMISLILIYFVTLSMFPGIVTQIESCSWGTWLPVILMAVFNLADTFGRILASIDKLHLQILKLYLIGPVCRFCFFPLVLFCCLPRQHPIISGDVWSILVVLLFAFTNGLFNVLPLSHAPTRVAPKDREMCGNMMMTAVIVTVVIGMAMAYVLDYSNDLHSTNMNCSISWNNLTSPKHGVKLSLM